MAYFFNSENGSMLPNSVGAGVTLAHFLFGVSLLIVKSRSVLSFQHMFGFPLWYYLLTTSYALFSGCAWSLWSLSVDQLSEANIAAVDDTQSYIAVGSFRYVILDAVNVLLMISIPLLIVLQNIYTYLYPKVITLFFLIHRAQLV